MNMGQETNIRPVAGTTEGGPGGLPGTKCASRGGRQMLTGNENETSATSDGGNAATDCFRRPKPSTRLRAKLQNEPYVVTVSFNFRNIDSIRMHHYLEKHFPTEVKSAPDSKIDSNRFQLAFRTNLKFKDFSHSFPKVKKYVKETWAGKPLTDADLEKLPLIPEYFHPDPPKPALEPVRTLFPSTKGATFV